MSGFDLVIIGAGPGGYTAAIRAAQLGLKTALVDDNPVLGGTCLRVGCIPSKALLESSYVFELARAGLATHGISAGEVKLDLAKMHERKDEVVERLTGGVASLMKKNGVQVFEGRGRLISTSRVEIGNGNGKSEIEAKNVLLATGSLPFELPGLPFDERRIVSSTGALSLGEVPGRLLVVGGGAIGLELGQVWQRLGAEVTVVEMLAQIAPFADKLAARMLQKALDGRGVRFKLKSKVERAEVSEKGVSVRLAGTEGESEELTCDKVLVSVGRKPNHAGLGLERVGIELDEKGRVQVDERLQTSQPGVYAIGDLVHGPMLAHKAEEEGAAVAAGLAGKQIVVNYDIIPAVVYTHPELAMVGKTEQQCKGEGLAFRSGRFYFAANGRAQASADTEGLVKVLAAEEDDRLLGVHIVGPCASELIAEAVMVMRKGGSSADIADTVHAHPTLSEALREAALAVDKRAIHA